MEINPTIDEKRVIDEVLAGKDSQFELLVQAYHHRLVVGLYAMLGNRHDAEDVAQEAFTTAYRRLAGFEFRSSFFTWLHRIAYNLAIDHKRREKRHTHKKVPNDRGGESMQQNLQASYSAPSDELEKHESCEAVHRALSQIDPERRAVLSLRDLQGLNYEEISECLSIPVGTVRSRLHRARLELKEVLLSQGQWKE